MTNNKDSRAISFDVNETLSFESGQGIAHMVSISVEPDILVQSYEEYIQIRGLIILQGEYERSKEDATVSSGKQMMEKVVETNHHRALFSHRFPVDITVSAYRVANLEDVTVTVDAFDYTLANPHTLEVQASVIIYGIDVAEAHIQSNGRNEVTKETELTSSNHDREASEVLSDPNEEIIEREKQFFQENDDVIVQDEIEKVMNPFEEIEEKAIEDAVASFSDTSAIENETKENEQEVESNVEEEAVQSSVIQSAEEEQVSLAKSSTHLADDEQLDEQLDGPTETEEDSVETAETEEQHNREIDIQLKESEEVEEDDVKDVQFLRELFGDDKEEEAHTQMRLYIAQSEDTVASIAKHYDVSTLQLVKDNELTSEDLIEGQILKIPVQQNK